MRGSLTIPIVSRVYKLFGSGNLPYKVRCKTASYSHGRISI